jgi:hypothetical protein
MTNSACRRELWIDQQIQMASEPRSKPRCLLHRVLRDFHWEGAKDFWQILFYPHEWVQQMEGTSVSWSEDERVQLARGEGVHTTVAAMTSSVPR